MNEFITVLKKYIVFTGRSARKEYWMYMLFNLIFGIVLGIISALVSDTKGIITTIYGLALLIPTISVSVRRLHDTGRSGWWYLINFVPLVGFIVMLVFTIQDSKPGQNQYGPNPKGL